MGTDGCTDLEFAKAIPLVIGGAIAIVSSLVAQWLTHHFTGERERQKVLLEKTEKMVNALYSHRRYMMESRDSLFSGAVSQTRADTFEEVLTLQQLYFPSLSDEREVLREATHMYLSRMLDENRQRTANKDEWDATAAEAVLMSIMDTYMSASNCFIQAICRKVPRKVRC